MEMDPETIRVLGKLGAATVVTLAAMGSVFGTGAAGMAAVGAWKKCYAQNKTAPFMLAVFVGAPITQTFYGMILMFKLAGAAAGDAPSPALLAWGVLGGLAIGMSAWMQGRTGAGASDALAETGQGFANYLMAIGIIESVALFVMVFGLIAA